jgi:hypothetical protein
VDGGALLPARGPCRCACEQIRPRDGGPRRLDGALLRWSPVLGISASQAQPVVLRGLGRCRAQGCQQRALRLVDSDEGEVS